MRERVERIQKAMLDDPQALTDEGTVSRAPWRDRDFLKLWSGQTLSNVGTAVTQLALPTAAIKLVGAGAFEVGLLGLLLYIAFPALGLFAGVWVDRLPRRPDSRISTCGVGASLLAGSRWRSTASSAENRRSVNIFGPPKSNCAKPATFRLSTGIGIDLSAYW